MLLIFVLIIILYFEIVTKVNSLESKHRFSMQQHHTDKVVQNGTTVFSFFQLVLNFSLSTLWKEINKCICNIFSGKEIKNQISTLDHTLSVLQHCCTIFLHLPVPTNKSTSLVEQSCPWSCLPASLLNTAAGSHTWEFISISWKAVLYLYTGKIESQWGPKMGHDSFRLVSGNNHSYANETNSDMQPNVQLIVKKKKASFLYQI